MRRFYPLLLLFPLAAQAAFCQAGCRDADAIAATATLAKGYFREAVVFHPGNILKVHQPSGHKEAVAYIQTGSKRYSIFTLVDENCRARFIKRTRQGD